MATIIAFGTQPDQVEAGMGGTILKLTELSHQVTIIDLTNGEYSKKQQPDNRKREAIKASRILGIDERITLDYFYPELENNKEIREEVSEIYHNTSPDIVFIPYPVDVNPESKVTAEICYTSFSQLYQHSNNYTKKKIFYYFAAPFTYYQKPTFIIDISKEIEMKVEALKCYESQFGQNLQDSQLFESTLSLSRYYGMLISTKFGESFICKEPLEIKHIELML
jgi:LmbE family N-acetylglucosaminyl deacetylase